MTEAGYKLYISETDDVAIEAVMFHRFTMIHREYSLVFSQEAPTGYRLADDRMESLLQDSDREWLMDCIRVLTEEYAEQNLKAIEERTGKFMIAFENELEFERQRTEAIRDGRNQ